MGCKVTSSNCSITKGIQFIIMIQWKAGTKECFFLDKWLKWLTYLFSVDWLIEPYRFCSAFYSNFSSSSTSSLWFWKGGVTQRTSGENYTITQTWSLWYWSLVHALMWAMNWGEAEKKAARGLLTTQKRCLSKHEYKQLGWRPCSAGECGKRDSLGPSPG